MRMLSHLINRSNRKHRGSSGWRELEMRSLCTFAWGGFGFVAYHCTWDFAGALCAALRHVDINPVWCDACLVFFYNSPYKCELCCQSFQHIRQSSILFGINTFTRISSVSTYCFLGYRFISLTLRNESEAYRIWAASGFACLGRWEAVRLLINNSIPRVQLLVCAPAMNVYLCDGIFQGLGRLVGTSIWSACSHLFI